MKLSSAGGLGVVLVVLITVQVICTVFFVGDILIDLSERVPGESLGMHSWMEILANICLATAIIFEAEYLRQLLRRNHSAERSLSVASGELQNVIDEYFSDWGLTPAEADIALFAMKGCSIAEIAQLRGSAEGTIKTHLNAIYRKAGVAGRAQLVSLLVEELLSGPVDGRQRSDTDATHRAASNG